jgi:hypothetical protein
MDTITAVTSAVNDLVPKIDASLRDKLDVLRTDNPTDRISPALHIHSKQFSPDLCYGGPYKRLIEAAENISRRNCEGPTETMADGIVFKFHSQNVFL